MKTLLVTTLALSCAVALAGPIRPIRSTTFAAISPCGPAWDPLATKGQWFLDLLTGTTNASTWELHDDDLFGASGISIQGFVQTIAYDGTAASNIVAFDVLAFVQNNLPAEPPMNTASNSHNEIQVPPVAIYQDGMMKQVRIVAEFAVATSSLLPSGNAPPYWPDPLSGGAYYIEAVNEDEWAWYCWTPGHPDPQLQPQGNFQVPAWRLAPPDLPPGMSGSVLMKFVVTGAGMPASDYRHSVIRASQQMGFDVLYNRHPSLKISHWLDTLLIDNGYYISTPPNVEEPVEYIYASDASVFFNSTFPGEKAVLRITPIATNQSPDAIQLDWMALDAINYRIQYCDALPSNTWTTLVPGMGIPPAIPMPMQWIDDGATITNLPVQQQPHRFYRLVE